MLSHYKSHHVSRSCWKASLSQPAVPPPVEADASSSYSDASPTTSYMKQGMNIEMDAIGVFKVSGTRLPSSQSFSSRGTPVPVVCDLSLILVHPVKGTCHPPIHSWICTTLARRWLRTLFRCHIGGGFSPKCLPAGGMASSLSVENKMG